MEKGAESILAENFLFPQPASAAPAAASACPRNGEVLLVASLPNHSKTTKLACCGVSEKRKFSVP